MRLVQGVTAVGLEKTLPLLTLDATADALIGERLASQDEVDAARASLAEFAADPGTVVAGPQIFQLWSRRENLP